MRGAVGRGVVLVLLAAVTAGCSGSSGAAPGTAGPAASTAGPAPQPPSRTPPPADPPSEAPAAPAARCRPADLQLSAVPQQGPPADQDRLRLVLVNRGPRPCLLRGFPGVDLVGPDDPTFGPRYALPRTGERPVPVTLPAGGTAHAVLTFLTPEPGPAPWRPDTIVLTPPDTTGQLTVPWPGGRAVLRQDAATHPGTYVGPVLPGTGGA